MNRVVILFLIVLSISIYSIDGVVTKVVDGDTIWILNNHKKFNVRLAHIDAPELEQEYGGESRIFLEYLVSGRQVEVDIINIDRYGRAVGDVWVSIGEDKKKVNVNLEMIRSGYAWHYKRYSKNKVCSEYETLAREKNMGLWSVRGKEQIIEPWVWRKKY